MKSDLFLLNFNASKKNADFQQFKIFFFQYNLNFREEITPKIHIKF